MKKVCLVGCSGIHANQEIMVENEVIIGRDLKVCNLIYPGTERGISGVHCKLQNYNGNITLTDLGSTNGTFLKSGERLSANVPYNLQGGQSFYLGDRNNMYTIKVEEVVTPAPVPVSAAVPESTPVQQPVSVVQTQAPQINKMLPGVIAAVATVIVGIVIVVAIMNVNNLKREAQEAQQAAQRAQQELYEEQNKNPLEKSIDAVLSWFD